MSNIKWQQSNNGVLNPEYIYFGLRIWQRWYCKSMGKKMYCSINYFGRMVMKLQKMSPPQNIFLKFPDESTRNIIKTNIIEENIRD